jgi:hypothetical protein
MILGISIPCHVLNIVMLMVIMLSVVMLIVIMLIVIMLIVVMLSVIMLSVVKLSVMMPQSQIKSPTIEISHDKLKIERKKFVRSFVNTNYGANVIRISTTVIYKWAK